MTFFKNLIRIYKKEGLGYLVSKVWAKSVTKVFQLDCMEIFITTQQSERNVNSSAIINEVNIYQASFADFRDKCPYDSRAEIHQFLFSATSRLERGEVAYVAELDTVIVAYAWIVSVDAIYIPEVKSNIILDSGSDLSNIIIKNCWTHPSYRSKGLYTEVLQYIIDTYQQSLKVIYCRCDNKPSRAGIIKLFQPHQKIYCLSLFGFSYSWNRLLYSYS